MEHTKILVDTSVVIDFIRKKQKDETHFWYFMSNYQCFISVVSVFELYNGAIDDNKKEDINKIIKWLNVIPFDFSCSLKASEIYLSLKKVNRLVEFRDIFIAATSITSGKPLATLNIKHFKPISGISIIPQIL